MVTRRAFFTSASHGALGLALGAPPLGARALDMLTSDRHDDVRVAEVGLRTADGRTTSCRVIAPAAERRCRVLLFSHGAASTNRAYDRVLCVWARSGYLVIAPDHLDAGRTPPQSELTHAELWTSRVLDLQAVLDDRAALETLGASQGWRPDWSRLGATGHSFGALTAQALAGARALPPVIAAPDPRVKAVLSLSPPSLMKDFLVENTWEDLRVPLLVQTGTADTAPGFVDDWRMHLASFTGARSRIRWAAVGDRVDHVFGGRICTLRDIPDPIQRGPFEFLLKLSLKFLDAYVGGEREAATALERDFRDQAFAPALTLYRA
jgi:predicted dienelactone hydrolase